MIITSSLKIDLDTIRSYYIGKFVCVLADVMFFYTFLSENKTKRKTNKQKDFGPINFLQTIISVTPHI